jgi:hypothetical protein
MDRHISPDAILQVDEHATLAIIGKRKFSEHRTINHRASYGYPAYQFDRERIFAPQA